MDIPCLWRPGFCLWMNQGFLQRHLPSPIKWVRGELKSPHSKFLTYRLVPAFEDHSAQVLGDRELIKREHPYSQQLRHVKCKSSASLGGLELVCS